MVTLTPAAAAAAPSRTAFPPPSRPVTWSAYAAAVAATAGFMPLHLVWAFGVPLWADPARFDAWYATGGAAYLFTLSALALLPALLAVALVRPWGRTFPAPLPGLAGRRVPRMLLIVPGAAVSVLLTAYAVFAAVVLPSQWNDPNAIFQPWTVLYGIAQFAVWAAGLAIATRSYARRTAERSPGRA